MATSSSWFWKRLLFGLLLVLLGLPALQAKFRWATEAPLNGAYTVASHPIFSSESVLAGTFQPQLEHYLEDHLGFRNSLIRLRNQLSLSWLNVARSTNFVVGQQQALFGSNQVASYQGKDFLGEEQIQFRVRRLRAVQQALAQRGIPFLFVMAPNKARYQAETLPAHFQETTPGHSNYEVFMREMQAQQVNLLDASRLFQAWKDTTRYPLFPKGGLHWSGYGAALIADTLFPRMERLGHFNLIDFHRRGSVTVLHDSLRYTDADLSSALNLLFPYRPYPTAYPTVKFDSVQAGQQRPNLLLIGDSFNWSLMQFSPYLQTLFAPESRFWGLEGTVFVYADNYVKAGPELGQLDFRREIESRQFIMLLMTDHNLYNHTLIDRIYDLYYPLSDAAKGRIQQLEKQLNDKPENQQRLWEENYQGSHDLATELHEKALVLYEQEQISQQQ